jgi:hypothetical protein
MKKYYLFVLQNTIGMSEETIELYGKNVFFILISS